MDLRSAALAEKACRVSLGDAHAADGRARQCKSADGACGGQRRVVDGMPRVCMADGRRLTAAGTGTGSWAERSLRDRNHLPCARARCSAADIRAVSESW